MTVRVHKEPKLGRYHKYQRCQCSGAGNCHCGMADRWRNHQSLLWRIFHRRPWR